MLPSRSTNDEHESLSFGHHATNDRVDTYRSNSTAMDRLLRQERYHMPWKPNLDSSRPDNDQYHVTNTPPLTTPSSLLLSAHRPGSDVSDTHGEQEVGFFDTPLEYTAANGKDTETQHGVECEYCHKILTGPHASGNLVRHQKSRECPAPKDFLTFSCHICHKSYKRSDDTLRNHLRRCHDSVTIPGIDTIHGNKGSLHDGMRSSKRRYNIKQDPIEHNGEEVVGSRIDADNNNEGVSQPEASTNRTNVVGSISNEEALKMFRAIDRQGDYTTPFEDVHVSPVTECEAHVLQDYLNLEDTNWEDIQSQLPESWMWDVEYSDGFWTCVPADPTDPRQFPLTIAGKPLVLPVEYRWPPMAGVTPPPDPRPSTPIDCRNELPLETIRDIFATFDGSVGFYMLVNGLLQMIVPKDFDRGWASSHFPHKYGGLKVCYITQDIEPTMFSGTRTAGSANKDSPQNSPPTKILKSVKEGSIPVVKSLHLNDSIEARPKSILRKERYSGKIGLRVTKDSESYILMSTHVITEAILSRSLVSSVFRSGSQFGKLDEDWNKHAEIWAGNEKIGHIAKSFDPKAGYYPDGFHHDVTLIKSADESSTSSIRSPIPNLGWINKSVHGSFRHRSQHIRFLGDVSGLHSDRKAKTLKTNTYSEALIVGQGILRNQTNFDDSSIETEFGHSKWSELISTSILYRVAPDFDPPNGYSGIALCADGERHDGTEGPGVLGFQSFVQRSGAVQNFNMEGDALAVRLKHGRVAFYGAYPVPEELKEYDIA